MKIRGYGVSMNLFIPLKAAAIGFYKFNYWENDIWYLGVGLTLFLIGISFTIEKQVEE